MMFPDSQKLVDYSFAQSRVVFVGTSKNSRYLPLLACIGFLPCLFACLLCHQPFFCYVIAFHAFAAHQSSWVGMHYVDL
jgi:ABC-type polysaccharide transport system permease subunit